MGQSVSSDRRNLSCTYWSNYDNQFEIQVTAHSNVVNLVTNSHFVTNETFTFYSGVEGSGIENISSLLGGEVKITGDPSKASFPTGTFEGLGITDQVEASLVKLSASVVSTLTAGAPRRMALAPSAFPAGVYQRLAKAPNLPAGSSGGLYDLSAKKRSDKSKPKVASGKRYNLEMAYSGNVDASKLNVFYFNESKNQWELETVSRVVDETKKTINIAVNHFSLFALVASDAPSIGGNAYEGGDFQAFNFPNPFDLTSKTVNLYKSGVGTATTTGTMIRYALPVSMTGDVTFEFYNLAGVKVRTIKETNMTGGYFYYKDWDGKNDDGSEVASGPYFCVAKAKGATKTFKLAVVK